MRNKLFYIIFLFVFTFGELQSAFAGKDNYPGGISTQPSGTSYCLNQSASALNVVISITSCSSGAGTNVSRTFTWYKTSTSCSGGTIVLTDGPNTNSSSSYTPSTSALGTQYYYCVISWGAGPNCASAGSLTSNCAAIVVSSPSTATWLTTGTTDWGTPANWSTGVVPNECYGVVIPSGGNQPTLNGSGKCNNLTVNNGANLIITASFPFVGILDIYGNLTNDGNINDAAGSVDFYGSNNTWGGTGTFMNGATQAGWPRIRDGASYTMTSNQTIKAINSGATSTGHLYLGSNTLTITQSLNNIFYLHYNTGMVDLRGGGSVDVAKSDYGTGTLWVNSSVNGFNFNLEDDYYNVWFSNSAGTTKFGSSAIDVYITNDIWIKTGTLDLSSAGTNNIHVGGDFINDATLSSATAGIIMDGSIAQEITGSSSTTFNKLTINNSFTGVTLNVTGATKNTNVSNILTLTDGPLVLNSQTLTITNAATTAVTGGSVNSHVVSETNTAVNPSVMTWNIGSTTGSHIFPFGRTDGTYIPVTFNNSGNAGNVSISTRRTTNACTTPCATAGACNLPWAGASNVASVGNMNNITLGGDATCVSVIDRWWNITSSLASPLASSVSLSLTYSGDENTITPSNDPLGIQHWNGTIWNAGTSAGTASGTYVATGSSGVTSGTQTVSGSDFVYFSPYVISRTSAPLPVELLSFTADCKGDKVVTDWETGSETNADYFTLEKSTDGSVFYPVTNVQAAGNSSAIKKYSAEDAEPFSAASYYRLSETDFNGQKEIFAMIHVKSCGNDAISAFSSGHDVTLMISSKEDNNYNIVLMDAAGKIVLNKKEFFAAGNNIKTFSVNTSNGIYVLKVFNDKNLRVQKLFMLQ